MPKKGMFINAQILFRHRDRSTALVFNRLHLEKVNYSYLFFNFEELSNAIDAWGCLDGPTTGWIKEMADLKMETAA
jgi:hypothetical protein